MNDNHNSSPRNYATGDISRENENTFSGKSHLPTSLQDMDVAVKGKKPIITTWLYNNGDVNGEQMTSKTVTVIIIIIIRHGNSAATIT